MALTVAELAQRKHETIAYLLVIDGLPYAWTDTYDLVGSGAGSWLGDNPPAKWETGAILLGHGRTEADPLVPETWGDASVDLDTGRLSCGELTFNLVDRDGVLIDLLKEPTDEERDFIAERVAPLDDPAPTSVIGLGGDTVNLWERCIGPETIGSHGERHMFPGIPGSTVPGHDHAAIDSSDASIAYSQVTDNPEWLHGRRVYLYVIRYDPTSQTWPAWQDQMDSGYSLVWWGTTSKLAAEGHVYKLTCSGEDSLLRKPLNVNSPADWRSCSTKVSLRNTVGQREDLMAVGFQYVHYDDATQDKRCGFSLFDVAADLLPSDVDANTLRAAINTRLQTLASTAGPDATWSTHRLGTIKFDGTGVAVQVEQGSPALCGKVALCLHEKVWRSLGWDPIEQNRTYQEIETTRDVHVLSANPTFQIWAGAAAPAPGPGYYVFYLTTLPFGEDYASAKVYCDNEGKTRLYQPLTEPGVTMLFPEGKQEVSLVFGLGPYATGQLARPVANHTMVSGAVCDRTGFIAFRGPYRESLEEDPRDLVQVAKVSWADDGADSFGDDGTGARTVYVERWLDPRIFGFTDPPLDRVWAGNTIEWAMLGVVGYNTNTVDAAHKVLLRLLLSTGTKVWEEGSYEGEPGANITIGANGHPDAASPHLEGDDQDIADLGLAVPHEIVNWQSFVRAAEDLPGGFKGALNHVKIAYRGPFDSQELIEDILAPRAWCMGLEGYAYSLFALGAPLDADDATVTLGQADFASDDFPYVPEVDLSPLAELAFNRGQIEYHYPATGEGGETSTLQIKALSPKAIARHGNGGPDLKGRGLLDRKHWIGDEDNAPPPDWIGSFRSLWQGFLADYYLQPHVMVMGLPIKPPKAHEINVGTVVLFTDPWPPNKRGGYGYVGDVGRVLKVRRNRDTLVAECDILVQAGNANTVRRFAPIAAIVDDVATTEERYHPVLDKLFCKADMFGHGSGVSDVSYFAEPAWSGTGGSAKIYGYGYNGRRWQYRWSALVNSVDTAAHTITLKGGFLDGAFREREYTIVTMAPFDDLDQADWVKGLFLITTDSKGKHNGTKGPELVK